jgi:hypothetical protein
MALADLSFKLYTDAALTTLAAPILQILHINDLSDNPQDFQFWFGSTDATHQLQAASNPGVAQITLTPTDTLAEWTAATVYAVGALRGPTTPNGFRYRVTTGGTSHATTEPTWPTGAIGSTVVDGSVVWTLESQHHETTEIKLALTQGALAAATPGAALNLGATILGGVANAVEFWLRKTNAVTTVGDNTGFAEHGIFINEVIETII